MTNHLDCDTVQRNASAFLDGRLSADARGAIQAHLRECASCVAELRMLRRLSRATHNLPPRPVVADLAQCVRERVADRRSEQMSQLDRTSYHRVAVAAAAVVIVLVGGAWWLGYVMGKSVEPDPAPPRSVDRLPEEPQPRPERARPKPSTDADFTLAAHGLLRDLAMIERVAPRGRKPLLQSQVSFFDLENRADAVLASDRDHPMATFVRDFSRALRTETTPDWNHWHRTAVDRELFPASRQGKQGKSKLRPRRERPDRERVNTIVDECAKDLPTADRTALAELLELKFGFVHGHTGPSRQFAIRLRNDARPLPQTFAMPMQIVVAETLSKAGLEEDARPVFTRLFTHVERRSTNGGRTQTIKIRAAASSQELLDKILRELGQRDEPIK